jgi:ribosomal protein RSM22 (predicted rRNA methylase)
MELPPLLRRNVDRALSDIGLADLAAAAAALSQRYRDERRDDDLHVRSERDGLAYLAVRLPATYAAVRASFAEIATARPDFVPRTALDISVRDRGPRFGLPLIAGLISPTHCWSR